MAIIILQHLSSPASVAHVCTTSNVCTVFSSRFSGWFFRGLVFPFPTLAPQLLHRSSTRNSMKFRNVSSKCLFFQILRLILSNKFDAFRTDFDENVADNVIRQILKNNNYWQISNCGVWIRSRITFFRNNIVSREKHWEVFVTSTTTGFNSWSPGKPRPTKVPDAEDDPESHGHGRRRGAHGYQEERTVDSPAGSDGLGERSSACFSELKPGHSGRKDLRYLLCLRVPRSGDEGTCPVASPRTRLQHLAALTGLQTECGALRVPKLVLLEEALKRFFLRYEHPLPTRYVFTSKRWNSPTNSPTIDRQLSFKPFFSSVYYAMTAEFS